MCVHWRVASRYGFAHCQSLTHSLQFEVLPATQIKDGIGKQICLWVRASCRHGPQQKAQRANAVLGLAPLTFQPLDPNMQKVLDAIKTTNSIQNPINNSVNNPINNPINNKRRKLENWAKNQQIAQEHPDLSATDKMSDGKNASLFH